MSRWTQVDVFAGNDVFTFETGNRDLAEALSIKLHEDREYRGADAIAFLNRNQAWHEFTSAHYRELVMRITHKEREQFSEEVLNLMTSRCISFDEKAKTYERMSVEWPIGIRIFYAG